MAIFYTIPASSAKKKIMYLAATVLLLFMLFLPYKEIRLERIRAFGENKAIGIVISKSVRKEELSRAKPSVQQYIIRYTFIDPSGIPRERTAIVKKEFWEEITRGDSVVVHYAKAEPGVSRLEDEHESAVVKFLARFSRKSAH